MNVHDATINEIKEAVIAAGAPLAGPLVLEGKMSVAVADGHDRATVTFDTHDGFRNLPR